MNVRRNQSWASFLPLALCLIALLIDLQLAAAAALMAAFVLCSALFLRQDDELLKIILLAAFVRAALTIVNHYAVIFPPQPDSVMYNQYAMQIVDNLERNLSPFYESPHSMSIKSFSYFLALFYRWLGEAPLVISMVNTVLGLLTALLAYRIALLVFENKPTARFALISTLVFPSMIVFTTYVLRDALIFFLTLLMLYSGVRAVYGRQRFRNSVMAAVSFLLLAVFRVQNLFLFGGFLAVYALIYLLLQKRGRALKWTLFAAALAALLILLASHREMVNSIINYPLRAQPLRAEGRSVYLADMQYRSLFDMIRYLPIRFVFFTFGPFLWNVYSAPMLMSALESLFVMLTAALTVLYFVKKRLPVNLSTQWFLLAFCLTCLAANALVDSNFGTSVRHRLPYIIFFFTFAGAYLCDVKIRLL